MNGGRRRWTEERLERCRVLFESGVKTAEIGARFGIAASTVAAMAWHKKWRRRAKPPRAGRQMVTVAIGTPASESAAAQGAALENAVIESAAIESGAIESAAAGGEVAVTARERAFNERLRRTIADYWRARGRRIELHVEAQGGDLLGIRSHSVNGMPAKR